MQFSRKLIPFTPLLVLVSFLSGCSALIGDSQIDEGVVIAPKEKLRSSTAMVSLEVAEVKRGDRLEILEQAEVATPTAIREWYKVRTKAVDPVTGWIEARYVVSKSVIEKIDQLNARAKDTPAQGAGRLKVQARLRIEPGGEVVTLLSKNTSVEIVGRARTVFKPERQQDGDDNNEVNEEPEEKTILWYQVRMPEGEVIRGGWVGAQQVQLDVPDEILHLEGDGRRFTGWITLDRTRNRQGQTFNNYVGLMKSYDTEGPVDYTRLYLLVYDPNQNRYFGKAIDGLRGVLPVTPGTASSRPGFTAHELDQNNNPVPVEFLLERRGAQIIRFERLSPKIEGRKPARPGRP